MALTPATIAARDGDERAEEASAEEAPPDPGQTDQFESDRGQCHGEGNAVLGYQEGQGGQHSAEKRACPGDGSAQMGIAAAGQVPGVGQAFGEGHADTGADCGGQPGEERVARLVRGERDGEGRCQRGRRAVDQSGHGGLRTLQEKRTHVLVLGRPQ
jgi:hypothetical protein